MDDLHGIYVAILVTDGFEQNEMTVPREALELAGATTSIVSPNGEVQGWWHHEKGDIFKVDVPLQTADPSDFNALLLPGGVVNPDALRIDPNAIAFIRHFVETDKPIAAICHGPWTLIEVDAVRGRTVTSWPSLKTDLKNAGATWVDRHVVVDGRLVTSRKPDDIPAFNREMTKLFANKVVAHIK